MTLLYYIFRVFPIKRKIVVSNYNGLGFGDNVKAIVLELYRLFPEIDIVWLVNKKDDSIPKWIRQVKNKSLFAIYEMVTSQIWIDNTRKPVYVRKRKGQFYIQTWHGSIALKRIENDCGSALPQSYITMAKNDAKMTNVMISNGTFCTEMYKRAFWYDGDIWEVGSPRCDQLINSRKKYNNVRRLYGISSEETVLLYAPTFRKGGKNVYDLDFDKLRNALKRKYNKDVKILVRMHPNIQNLNYGFIFNNYILNASTYSDMNDLLSECDFLITDYSSCMFDMAYAGKTVLIYAPDIDDYKKDRGFYFPINSLPFPVATNNNELFNVIMKFNEVKYLNDLRSFFEANGVKECGNASIIVANRIIKLMTK